MIRPRSGRLGATLLLCLLWSTLALAGDPKDDQRVARELFQKGITAYNLGDYDKSVAELKRAYELSNQPQLLFNIAQALRAKRDHAAALVFYRNYLRLVPNAPNRADAESLALEMQQRAAEDDKRAAEARRLDEERRAEQARLAEEVKRAEALRRAAEATAQAERQRAEVAAVASQQRLVAAPPKKPVYKRWWLWTTVGVVVGVGVGVGLGVGLSRPRVVLPEGSLGTIDGRAP